MKGGTLGPLARHGERPDRRRRDAAGTVEAAKAALTALASGGGLQGRARGGRWSLAACLALRPSAREDRAVAREA